MCDRALTTPLAPLHKGGKGSAAVAEAVQQCRDEGDSPVFSDRRLLRHRCQGPRTKVPSQPPTVVRQGSIPHGTSLLAQGAVIPTVNGGPVFQPIDSTPFTATGPISDPVYLAPFSDPPLPPGFKAPFLRNPNLALQEAIIGQTIARTEVLSVSTKASDAPRFNGGGLLNIPFLVSNANATQLDAIFWIETVQQPDGSEFMQLQYTQTVILSFLNISWPHISVATLVKQ